MFCGPDVYWKSLYFPLSFALNLTALKKILNSPLKKKIKEEEEEKIEEEEGSHLKTPVNKTSDNLRIKIKNYVRE